MEPFYDDIEREMAGSDSEYKISTDFNAKIGTKTKEEDFKSMAAFEIGERNERGDCIIEFADEHKVIIADGLFCGSQKLDTGLGSDLMEKEETREILHRVTKEE